MTAVAESKARIEERLWATAVDRDARYAVIRCANSARKSRDWRERMRVAEILVEHFGWVEGKDDYGRYVVHPDCTAKAIELGAAGLTSLTVQRKDLFEKRYGRFFGADVDAEAGAAAAQRWKEIDAVFFRLAAGNPCFKPRSTR